MTFVTSNMGSFLLQVEAERTRLLKLSDLFVQRFAFEAWTRILRRTPVDTGRARGNWQIERNRNNETFVWDLYDPTLAMGLNRIQSMKDQIEVGDVVNIFNNIFYVADLERGKSRQAPRGMVALTLSELRVMTA